ncbi:MAG: hypothetical protein Q8Q23_03715 [bacterium]|nr:hypothetical protein [bacterium]
MNLKNKKGNSLILTMLIVSLMLFLGMYFLSLALGDNKIANSHTYALRSYYLAEAGVQEAIFKIKNNIDGYGDSFVSASAWTVTFSRNAVFNSNDSYSVTITKTSQAHADIEATGIINISASSSAQRIVKTSVFKATGGNPLGNNGAYADGNIDISLSVANFLGGSAHSNNVFTVNGASTVNIDEDLNAVGNLVKSWLSNIFTRGVDIDTDSQYVHAQNYPPAAAEISMPAIDFDSVDSNSFLNQADVVYTANEFKTLLENNQTLTLNDPITYVTGDITIEGNTNLIINGILLSDRDIEIGKKLCFNGRCGNPDITITHNGHPTGLLAKRNLTMYVYTGNINLQGVAYANDQLTITGLPLNTFSFDAEGGLVSHKLTITSSWRPVNITLNNGYLDEIFVGFAFSPIITIEHWEEEY